MKVSGEVDLSLSLLDPRGGHGIVLVMEEVIRDEAVEDGVHDERPSIGKAIGVMDFWVDNDGVRCLNGSGKK